MAAINKIQNQTAFTQQKPNSEQKKSGSVNMERFLPLPKMHYKNHNEIPDSVNNIKPEPGQGHLLNGGIFGSIGRFFVNRAYDIKSVYKGYTGTANDHQLGRTNDVGLVLSGLGIASFLATKRVATMPKHMEFVGFASFLSSMAIWPKIGIFGPARLVHGFDVDKRYIDDQGRNKSVFQDPNYVPFDLYRGKKKSENLSAIADYMGISKEAPNREEIVKDQMIKIARQNNTLWMLTSGVAVPTLTALLCNGFERFYEPKVVAHKAQLHKEKLNAMYNNVIKNTASIELTPKSSKPSTISRAFTKFAQIDGPGKILTEKEITTFVNSVTKDAGAGVSAALSYDINKMLSQKDKIAVNQKYIEHLAANIKAAFESNSIEKLKDGILSGDEIKNALGMTDKQVKLIDVNDIQSKLTISVYNKLGSSLQNEIKNKIDKIVSGATKNTSGKISIVDQQFMENLAKNLEVKFQGHKLLKNGILSFDEIKNALDITDEQLKTGVTYNDKTIQSQLKAAINNKLAQSKIDKSNLSRVQAIAEKQLQGNEIIPKSTKFIMTKDTAESINSIGKAMEDYLVQFKQLKEINALKMGDIADSQNAFFWKKLEKTFTNIVHPNNVINSKDLKLLVDNNEAIKLDAKANLEALVKDEIAYKQAVRTISELKDNYIAAMLGDNLPANAYNDFIFGKYNNEGTSWNKRTFQHNLTEMDKFIELQTKLANNFKNNVDNNKFRRLVDVIAAGADNRTSIAYLETKANVNKVENFVTACDRIIHTLDIFRRSHLYKLADDFTIDKNALFEKAKLETLSAGSHDFFAKFNLRNKPHEFRKYMELVYGGAYLDPATKSVMSPTSLETTTTWLNRTRQILGNYIKLGNFGGTNNWLYSEFTLHEGIDSRYNDNLLKTSEAAYKLQGKTPVELLNQGFKNSYNSNKWLRTFGGLFVGVFALSILSQFFFGKKDSTIPKEKTRIAQKKLEFRNAKNNTVNANTQINRKLEKEVANAR